MLWLALLALGACQAARAVPGPTNPGELTQGQAYVRLRTQQLDQLAGSIHTLSVQFQKLDANNRLVTNPEWKQATRVAVVTLGDVGHAWRTSVPHPGDLDKLDQQFASIGDDLIALSNDAT